MNWNIRISGTSTQKQGEYYMKQILALTTINNTLSLKDAVEKIKKEHGDLVKIRKVY